MSFFQNIRSQLAGGAGGGAGAGVERCRLIVGLGNPGERYGNTRHNAGFFAVDAVASEFDVGNWRARFDSIVAEKKLELAGVGTLLVLAKPQTMMNRSGRAVKGLLKHYGLALDELCVLHDDIDLPPGSLRVKDGGGHGGHNGIRDIISTVGADFVRIKIGVGGPPGRMDSADYVLQPLKGEGLEEFRVDTARGGEAAAFLLEHTLVETQNHFN